MNVCSQSGKCFLCFQFPCDSDERLQPIGFIDSDLVYGVAKVSDIDTEDKGSEVFPMYKVLIVNSAGETLKTYEPDGCYVIGGSVNDKLLTLDRVKKTKRGYTETSQDHIVNSSADDEAAYTSGNVLISSLQVVCLLPRSQINCCLLFTTTPS